MSDDTSTTTIDGAEPGKAAPDFTPITSQEDLDRIIGKRLERATAKFADYDDLKAKAAKYDEMEEAKKTEIQREREAREAAERERDELRAARERSELMEKVSDETGVPKRLLTGTTEEEMREHAEALLEWQASSSKPRTPKPNPAQGNGSEPASGDWLRESLTGR